MSRLNSSTELVAQGEAEGIEFFCASDARFVSTLLDMKKVLRIILLLSKKIMVGFEKLTK